MIRLSVGIRFALLFPICLAAPHGLQAQDNSYSALLPEEQLPELKALLRKAVSQSPQAVTASLEVARLRAQEMVDQSAMWPSVNAYLSWAGVQSSIGGTASIKSRNSGFFYTLSLYQPIFHWGALKAQSDIAKLQTFAAEQRYAETYRTLVLSIRSNYLDLIQRKKAWNYSEANLKQEQSRYEALEQRQRAGAISPAELVDPRLRLAEARIAADRLEESFGSAARAVAAICGVSSISAESVPDEFPKPAFTEEQISALSTLASRYDPAKTPMGRVNQAALDQINLNYKIARTRLLPKFGLSATASEQNSTTALGGSLSQQNVSQQTVGVAANWALFDGFAAKGTKLALMQQKRQADLTISEYDRTQREKLESLKRQIGFAIRAMEVSETRLSISNNSVRVIAEEVKTGHSSPDGLEMVQSLTRKTELTTLGERTEFFARVAELLSLVGADPALASLDNTAAPNVR